MSEPNKDNPEAIASPFSGTAINRHEAPLISDYHDLLLGGAARRSLAAKHRGAFNLNSVASWSDIRACLRIGD